MLPCFPRTSIATVPAVWLAVLALLCLPAAPALAQPAARVKILSAGMVSHHVFRVRTQQDLPEQATVTVTAPFPGTPQLPTVTRTIPARDNQPRSFDFELDSMRVPRFTKTLKLTVTAAAQGISTTADTRRITIPLPVVTVHGISPSAAFLKRNPETGFGEMERALVRQSQREWGKENAYRRYTGEELRKKEPGYPTIFTFRWQSNRLALAEGAETLQRYVLLTVRPNTWADRVIVVGWSRGGNMTRYFLSHLAAPDGGHPYCAGALLACMPATGSPLPFFWDRFLGRVRTFPKAWNDVLPTYPWWRPEQERGGTAVPFEERPPLNVELEALNARARPAGVDVEVLFGTRAVRDTVIAITESVGPLNSPKEYGDYAVSRFSAQGQEIELDPADPTQVRVTSQAPWLQGVPVREFAFERRFRKPGVLHVAFLSQPSVTGYIFDWLDTHQVETAGGS